MGLTSLFADPPKSSGKVKPIQQVRAIVDSKLIDIDPFCLPRGASLLLWRWAGITT
jgi:hypothetical protein